MLKDEEKRREEGREGGRLAHSAAAVVDFFQEAKTAFIIYRRSFLLMWSLRQIIAAAHSVPANYALINEDKEYQNSEQFQWFSPF